MIEELIAAAKRWRDKALVWIWADAESIPPPSPLVLHPCLHGNESVDCEYFCSYCGHPCRAHTPACDAHWSTQEKGWTGNRGYGNIYVQHRCRCTSFRE